MTYLRGKAETEILGMVEEVIEAGVASASLPPTLELGYDTVGNVASATKEFAENLSEFRQSIVIGRENLYVLGNGAIVLAGAYTGGRSAVGFNLTNSSAAKGFYAVSTIFSAAAITNGGMAIMANICTISKAGVLTEALGFAFMRVGELAHVAALHAENKPIPPHLQYIKQWSEKPIRKSRFVNSGNLGFTMPGAKCGDFSFLSETIAKIPYQRIGQFVSISLTVYSYYKIVVTSYRYGQKLAYKFKKARQSKLLLKQASFIVNSFNYG